MSLSCVVINLDDKPQRLARMEKRLAVLGYSWRRFNAITPDRITQPFLERATPAMHACAQSHFAVWLEAQKAQSPYTLICEDDVMFRKDAAPVILRALQDIPQLDQEWHALFLNHSDAIDEHETWRPITHNATTGAYILSALGVNLLIEKFSAGLWVADAMTGWWLQPLGHSYGYFPWLAIQEYADSSLQTVDHTTADRRKRDELLATTSRTIFDYF